MKKRKRLSLLFSIFVFTILFFNGTGVVNAVGEGGNAGNRTGNVNGGCSGKDSCWHKARYGNKVVNAIRITAYNVNGNRISESRDYVNSTTAQYLLNTECHKRVNRTTDIGKIDYLAGRGWINFDACSYDYGIGYMGFPDILGESATSSNSTSFKNWFLNNIINNKPQLTSLLNELRANTGSTEGSSGYYLAVEPATVVTSGSTDYYVTAYEIFSVSGGNIAAVKNRSLPPAIYVSTEQERDEFNFIGNLIYQISPSDARNRTVNTGSAESQVHSRQGYGIGLFWVSNPPMCDI